VSTKVVFLDIDGVLNGYPFLDEVEANSTAAPLSREWWSEFIDDARVERLNHILEVTGAKVVLSSSWRMRWPYKELQELFEEHGFRGEFVDATGDEPRGKRGAQIARWLQYAPFEVFSYVCLDDDLDMKEVEERWVQTSPDRGGITEEEVERAIALLEQPLGPTSEQ